MDLKYLLLLGCLTAVWCQDEEPPSDERAPARLVGFLKQYGYLKKGQENNLASLTDAIKSMQAFGGVKITGKVDKETLALMDMPRCGMADLEEEDIRGKRYAVSKKKWPETALKYQIHNYPSNSEGMSNADVESAIAAGLQKWTDVVPALTFTKVDSGAHLNIVFCSTTHPEDPAHFDGRGGILGHAYYPTSGKFHFDDSEIWCKDPPVDPAAKLLEYVATHEGGHALGLKHSDAPGSVMAAYYPGYDTAYTLAQDDKDGITFLYG